MLDTYSIEQLRPLVSHEVVDADGDVVGYVDVVFLDEDSGRPEWIGLWGGLPGEQRVLVPIQGIEREDDEIRVPWPKDVIETAPRYDDVDKTGLISGEGQIRISPEREREAYEHYGIEPPGKATGAPRLVVWEVEIRAETVRG